MEKGKREKWKKGKENLDVTHKKLMNFFVGIKLWRQDLRKSEIKFAKRRTRRRRKNGET